jgi:GTP cyclohydrolase II
MKARTHFRKNLAALEWNRLRQYRNSNTKTKLVASANLATRFGTFRIHAFADAGGSEHVAVVRGDVKGGERVPVRLHSECLTGDVLGSLKCDCGEQLEKALSFISAQEKGVFVYLRQEGRGIGLANKIKAYELQEKGYDTVEANEALGFPPDARDYSIAGKILEALGVRSVILLTNNPDKLAGMRMSGIKIEGRIPLLVKPNKYNGKYLRAKKRKLGHLL